MEHAWKVCKQKCFQGSNPCLTAINKKPGYKSGFLFMAVRSVQTIRIYLGNVEIPTGYTEGGRIMLNSVAMSSKRVAAGLAVKVGVEHSGLVLLGPILICYACT
jgi:hypothetical protein